MRLFVAIAKWVQLSHTGLTMEVAYAAETEVEPLYIYRRPTIDGTSFSLAPLMKRRLREYFGPHVHARGSVFIDHATRDEYATFYADLASQVIQLLTGMTRERLEEKFGSVIFLDPETDEEVQPKSRP
jgi:hypothetical protein